MRFSVEGKCPKVQAIEIEEPTCKCEITVGEGLNVTDGEHITVNVDKLKELLGIN